jgi:hypothetical protein
VDDRILFLPPFFAPDPDVLEGWPAFDVLLQRLRERWPVDLLRWPTLLGEKVEGTGWAALSNALFRELRPEHHLVNWGATPAIDWLLLAGMPVRSLITSDFQPDPGALDALDRQAEATAILARIAIAATPAQIIPGCMVGAKPEFVSAAVEAVEATLDRALVFQLVNDRQYTDRRGRRHFDAPALYLSHREPPKADSWLVLFRSAVPDTRVEYVREAYGWHKRENGEEFADKAIPFIEEVIAQRETAGQT